MNVSTDGVTRPTSWFAAAGVSRYGFALLLVLGAILDNL
jgi:hypothetical protein